MEKHQKRVKHIEVRGDMTVDELVREFGKSGVFGAGRVAEATDVLYEIVSRKDVTTYLGLAGRWCQEECGRSSPTSSATASSTCS